MTNLFLLNEDVNVIVVDWGGGSSGLYSQTAANTRLVGLEVAALIDYLMVQCKKKRRSSFNHLSFNNWIPTTLFCLFRSTKAVD